MKIFYIADFFIEDIRGGAEICDDILLSLLKKENHKVVRFRAAEVTPKHIGLYGGQGFHFLISNFTQLRPLTMEALVRDPGSYSIMEHDHKYIRHRDPSRYPDFKVPASEIINQLFYSNAKNVFAQSALHRDVISKNLNIDVINLGMSLWSDEQLEILQKNSTAVKNPTHAVLDSSNPTKNTHRNIGFCETRKLAYTKIGSPDYATFIEQLGACEKLVFFPAVLETFNRLIVEAKMLNCKVVTNNLNGCISEPWFKDLSGSELIEFARTQRSAVVQKVTDALESNKKRNNPEDITVILNAYRRPYNLKMQIEALRAQTHPPKNIWLWVNAHDDNKNFDLESLDVDRVFKNDHNWKFYGRFAAALLADTEYIAIYDDDTIPGKQWHSNCLDTMKTHEGILGSAGVTLKGSRYVQHERCGWPTQNTETTEVDLVGHAWFFKREWLRYLWQEKPTTWDNGEDIQFAFMSKIYGGVRTYCPPHPPDNKELHGSILGNELGIDSKATSNNQETSHVQFFSQRDVCVAAGLKKGWKTVNEVTLL
jgi:hypothetical protein